MTTEQAKAPPTGDDWFGPVPKSGKADEEMVWYRRSRLQAVAFQCPKQAKLAPGAATSVPARFGSLGHDLLLDYMGHLLTSSIPRDKDYLIEEARKCPDPTLQPEMVSCAKRLAGRIWLPQGRVVGVELSLGAEIMAGVGVSGELDRLDQTPRKDELSIEDYKFGFGMMTAAEARRDFQVRCYVWLVFKNYPEVNRVWFVLHYLRQDDPEARDAYRQIRIDFVREQMDDLEGHVLSAVMATRRIEEEGKWPARPGYPQCLDCSLLYRCREADPWAIDLEGDPQAWAGKLYAATQHVAAAKKALRAWCEELGPVPLETGGAWTISTTKKATFGFDRKYEHAHDRGNEAAGG